MCSIETPPRLACARNHVLFSDAALNTEETIYLNIYQNFILASYKMQEYIRGGGLKMAKNTGFVYSKCLMCRKDRSFISI